MGCTGRAVFHASEKATAGDPMTINPRKDTTEAALRTALIACAEELGIDPATIGAPSSHAITARRQDGSLLRLDFDTWLAAELSR